MLELKDLSQLLTVFVSDYTILEKLATAITFAKMNACTLHTSIINPNQLQEAQNLSKFSQKGNCLLYNLNKSTKITIITAPIVKKTTYNNFHLYPLQNSSKVFIQNFYLSMNRTTSF